WRRDPDRDARPVRIRRRAPHPVADADARAHFPADTQRQMMPRFNDFNNMFAEHFSKEDSVLDSKCEPHVNGERNERIGSESSQTALTNRLSDGSRTKTGVRA